MELQVRSGILPDVWHVALVGDNGETVMVSETYANKGNAKRAADTVAEAFNDQMEYIDVKVEGEETV